MKKILLQWTTIIPVITWLLYFSGVIPNNGIIQVIAGLLLILSVMAAVHHSEIIAHRVGEPFGTIILAVAVTIIEVSIIISLMVAGGKEAASLARDTVFSATMLILNGIIGLCLFIGSLKFHEQSFSKHSVTIALVSLVSIVVLTMVFPSYTSSVAGPYYSTSQLILVSVACLIIYAFFLLAQTKRHRDYFLSGDNDEAHATMITNREMIFSLVLLLLSLIIVVLLAKELSPTIENIVVSYNLPKALVGVIIAAVILLPEAIAAINAARKNKLQTSINLALGSALASIGLTIPAVATVSSIYDMKIILGLDNKSIILLGLSVFIVMLSLISGRTNLIYGVVLLVNLLTFIFLIIHP